MASKSSSKPKPNMRMVAERAQLSPATVSLALRGSESIPPETRARVLAAARELNYVPALRTPRSARVAEKQILFLTKDFGDRPVTSNPFYGEILRAAELACGEHSARMLFSLLAEDPDTNNLTTLTAYQPDGMLLVGAYPPAVVKQVSNAVQAPLVLVDNFVPGLPCDSVMADDFGGAWRATQHLLDLGHRHIAALGGSVDVPSFEARYRGFRAACLDAGTQAPPPVVTTWERPVLRTTLEEIMARTPRPTAIFCVTDAYAVFTMEVLRDMGFSVPGDVSVVGFDNLPIARMAHPPLTTIHNHPEELGRIAVERLLRRIDGDTNPPLSITVATQLTLRSSTRAV